MLLRLLGGFGVFLGCFPVIWGFRALWFSGFLVLGVLLFLGFHSWNCVFDCSFGFAVWFGF